MQLELRGRIAGRCRRDIRLRIPDYRSILPCRGKIWMFRLIFQRKLMYRWTMPSTPVVWFENYLDCIPRIDQSLNESSTNQRISSLRTCYYRNKRKLWWEVDCSVQSISNHFILPGCFRVFAFHSRMLSQLRQNQPTILHIYNINKETNKRINN